MAREKGFLVVIDMRGKQTWTNVRHILKALSVWFFFRLKNMDSYKNNKKLYTLITAKNSGISFKNLD